LEVEIMRPEIPKIWLAEPTSQENQRKLTDALHGKPIKLSLGYVKSRLKLIRQHSIENMALLAEGFKDAVKNFQGVKLIEANDAKEAAKFVSKIAEDNRTIGVNNSSVVNELRRELEQENLQIVDTYYDQYVSKEKGGEIKYYWQLPEKFPEITWDSFKFREFDYGQFSKTKSSSEIGLGILGVNAASAQDGAIFLLQHSQNISQKILEETNKIAFIIGIDKIVKDAEDAAFQTKCVGLFGVERIMLGLSAALSVKENQPQKTLSNPNRPRQGSDTKEVYVILLDNHRKDVLKSEFRELLYCIGCGACLKLCPRYAFSRKNQPYNPYMWNPKEIMFTTFTIGCQIAEEVGLYECTLCGNCKRLCPLEIPLDDFMLKMRGICDERGIVPKIHLNLYERIKKYGNPYRTD
jgi:L-lactate utilization protein LutB